MNNIKWSASLILLLVLASCSIQQEAFSGKSIQKRKYTKGFYWDRMVSFKKSQKSVEIQSDSPETATEITVEIQQTKAKTEGLEVQRESEMVVDQTVVQQNEDQKSSKKRISSKKSSVPQSRQRKLRTADYYLPIVASHRTENNALSAASNVNVNTVVLVILALLIPPLAVFLFEGATKRFWIDLILAIIGIGIGFGILHIAFLCALIAVIYALLIVLEII
jgi:uncharacterized membrane protein YqaE (UPF0057 family)